MTTVLDQKHHAKILQDFERVCAVAGLQGKFMYESMTVYCGPTEVEWVRKFREFRSKGVAGLVLNGVTGPDTKCQAICAALLRNYIDARVMPLNMLLDMNKDGNLPQPSVLLIPNLAVAFHKGKMADKATSPWSVQAVYDILMQRAVRNKPTVVYVESMNKLVEVYGKPFYDFLSSSFMIANPSEQ